MAASSARRARPSSAHRRPSCSRAARQGSSRPRRRTSPGCGALARPAPRYRRGLPLGARAVSRRSAPRRSRGGTDVCSAFVGGSPLVPVWEGELSCRCLGAAVRRLRRAGPLGRRAAGRACRHRAHAFDAGRLLGRRRRQPLPGGLLRGVPGVWRHGDWITITDRGSCTITGRSDATLNRGGVRLGTAELYSVVEARPECVDSLVVHLEDAAGGPGELLLFVVLAPSAVLDDDLRADLARVLRRAVAAPRAGCGARRACDPPHPVRQTAGGADQAHPHRHASRGRGQRPAHWPTNRARRLRRPGSPLAAPEDLAQPGRRGAAALGVGAGKVCPLTLVVRGSGRFESGLTLNGSYLVARRLQVIEATSKLFDRGGLARAAAQAQRLKRSVPTGRIASHSIRSTSDAKRREGLSAAGERESAHLGEASICGQCRFLQGRGRARRSRLRGRPCRHVRPPLRMLAAGDGGGRRVRETTATSSARALAARG